ncbi:hypothetical protein HZA44_02595 [Candidatus Peregrinibacteria bacterium]|nr:hypothetical protein [Candidatus Peregrinibacteria bacterium]
MATKRSKWAYALVGLVSVALLAMAWMAYKNPQIFRAFTGGFGGGSYNPPATGGGMVNPQGGFTAPNANLQTPQVGLQGSGTKITPTKLEMPNPDGGGTGGGLPPLPKVVPIIDMGLLPASELKKQVVGSEGFQQIPGDIVKIELPPLYLTLNPDDAPTKQLPGSILKFVVYYNMDEATIQSDCGDASHIGLMDGANFIKVDSRTTLGGTYSNVAGEGPTFRFDNYTLPTTVGGHDFKAVCMEKKVRTVIRQNQTVHETYYEANPDLASGILHVDVNLCGNGKVLGGVEGDYGTCELKPEVTCDSDMDCVLTPGSAGGVCEAVEECDNGGLCADNTTACKSNADCSSVGGSCTPRSGDGCSNECKVERGYSCANTIHQIGVEIPTPVLMTDACTATCGDSIRAGAEQCDKNDLGSKTCNDIVAGSIGTLACNNSAQGGTCTFNTNGCYVNPCNANACNTHGTCTDNNGAAVCACTGNWTGATCSTCKPGFSGPNCDPTPVCGDNVKNRAEEECDGTDLAGKTCVTEVGQGSTGTLRCTTGANGCKIDKTACSAAVCTPATCFTDVDASKVDDYLLGLYTLTASEAVRYDTNCSGSITDGDAGYIADHASSSCP